MLLQLKDGGGWSDVFWETAENVADGDTRSAASSLGCE